MPLVEFTCRICSARELEEFVGFAELPRVTSDCKVFPPGGRLALCCACGAVQKPTDANLEIETASIYRNYEPYYQSGGVEQAVFDPAEGTPRRRSNVVIERLTQLHSLGPIGSILDVGCGNGALLRAFSQARPGWRLFGHELSDLHAIMLATIPGFEQLYSGWLSDLPSGLDLITMIHALEHFLDPVAALRDLRPKLSEAGFILIQVPNANTTPFDLVVADHVSHFTKQDLGRVIARAGMGTISIADDWVTKELSVVALSKRPVVAHSADTAVARTFDRVQTQIRWLNAVVRDVCEAARHSPFGLFGTSIAAMWLFGQLADEISFFVDEDPSRCNTRLCGRPVHTPDEIPAGASVYIPLAPAVARAVRARLAWPQVVFYLPPEIDSRLSL